jgi:formylmethanofuran dehydrogenase subunit E
MKQFIAWCDSFQVGVNADTLEEAKKMALSHFISELENSMEVSEVKARTERCDICQYTYIPSEIIDTDGERLCVYCYDDKYGFGALSPDDIPF